MSDAAGPMVADLDRQTLSTKAEGRTLGVTRLLSLAALAVVVTLLWRGATVAYDAATDSFVAPMILSPDSESVIQHKLNLGRLEADRQNLQVRVDEAVVSIEAVDEVLALLRDLRGHSTRSLGWATRVAEGQKEHGVSDLETLRAQRTEIEASFARQQRYVADMEQGLTAGLARRSDVERERSVLNNLRVALLQNQREQGATGMQLRTALLAGRALRSRAEGLDTPEMFAQREHGARIHIEVLRSQAERQRRVAQMKADLEALGHLDELIAQMKSRPMFRATEGRQNVAFVTYKEITGVLPGSDVVRCELWGILGCSRVGTVSEVVPGEVTMPDPWGTVGRGQYALLDLTDITAAQSRSLRVRNPGAGGPAHASVPAPAR